LFDVKNDPFQKINSVVIPEYAYTGPVFDRFMNPKMKDNRDEFSAGIDLCCKMGIYPVDKTETVPYSQ